MNQKEHIESSSDCYTVACHELEEALDAEDKSKKDFHIRQAFQAMQGIASGNTEFE